MRLEMYASLEVLVCGSTSEIEKLVTCYQHKLSYSCSEFPDQRDRKPSASRRDLEVGSKNGRSPINRDRLPSREPTVSKVAE